jgi:hypothetical protein
MEDTAMTTKHFCTHCTILYCIAGFLLLINLSCSMPDAPPQFTNPDDPYSPSYRMEAPFCGPIESGSNRQIIFIFYNVDPYATLILMERRIGPNDTFVQIGTAPAASGGYTDIVPPSVYKDIYYRARYQAIGGALSPYQTTQVVYFP